MKIRYFFLPLIFHLVGCNNPTEIEKGYIKNLEEKNRILEKELIDLKNNSYSNKSIDSKPEIIKSKTYFTIGSTESEVIEVMGDPENYTSMGSFGKIFDYGLSSVTFRNGKVISYNNLDKNLKVRVGK